MNHPIRTTLLTVSLFILIVFSAGAEPVKASEISANAKWAVHLDLQRLLSSRIGSLVLEEAKKEKDFAKVEAFGTIVEFDPFKDLFSVTGYGNSFGEEKAVIIAKGRFDKEKILALIGMEGGGYKEMAYNDQTIYSPKEGGEDVFGAFFGHETLIFSNCQELLKEGLDVLAGRASSIAERGGLGTLVNPPSGAFLAAAAEGFGELGADIPQAAMLKKAQAASLTVGEFEGRDFVTLSLTAADEATARQVRDIVQGFVALGSIVGQEEPELAKLVQALKVDQNGRKVTVKHAMPADKVFKFLKENMD